MVGALASDMALQERTIEKLPHVKRLSSSDIFFPEGSRW